MSVLVKLLVKSDQQNTPWQPFAYLSPLSVFNIRIFNGCEVRNENSVTRASFLFHEAELCRTVIPSDGIFNWQRTTNMDYFSCILFLWQLHLSLNNKVRLGIVLPLFLVLVSLHLAKIFYQRHSPRNVTLLLPQSTCQERNSRSILYSLSRERHILLPGCFAQQGTFVTTRTLLTLFERSAASPL